MGADTLTTTKGRLPHGEGDPHSSIQVGHAPMMEDRTGTPIVSPKLLGVGVVELKVPALAVGLVMKARVQNIKWGRTSTLDGAAGQGNFVLEDGQQIEIPVAGLSGTGSIFVQELAVGGILDFYFVPLDDKTVEG